MQIGYILCLCVCVCVCVRGNTYKLFVWVIAIPLVLKAIGVYFVWILHYSF